MNVRAPCLVFAHGWGFDRSVWDRMRRVLPDFENEAIDLGFFGAPANPVPRPGRALVAVGHSFGALWLLCRDQSDWAAFVSINGFPRFTEAPSFMPAMGRRILDRMIARFDIMPEAVIEEFRLRSGAQIEIHGSPDIVRLRESLLALRDWDGRDRLRSLAVPILALAGGRDVIVPPGMSEHAFRGAIDFRLEWRPERGHMLPLDEPLWCAERIRTFLTDAGLCR
jgi:pimeloyl-[acyl-carrier protein] methyl ester esterase